jgi:outer membrane protein TolC
MPPASAASTCPLPSHYPQQHIAEEFFRGSLKLTRQRYEAGVTDNVEVVQAQDAVASAELDYINNLVAHNIAKLSLARAIAVADRYRAFLGTN